MDWSKKVMMKVMMEIQSQERSRRVMMKRK